MNKTFFAYHITHVFGKFNLNKYYTNSSAATDGDTIYVISGDKISQDNKVDYWLEGIFSVHRREKGNYPLQDLKGGIRTFEYLLSLKPIRIPEAPIALSNAAWYDRNECHRFFSSQQNFNPLPTTPNFKERFDLLLAEHGLTKDQELAEDLAELENTIPDATQRQVLAMARIGQGRFRAEVIRLWGLGETCALTGIDVPELLIASHIKPWRESNNEQRLAPENGLLLATHIDKLFDRHLLSFKPVKDEYFATIHPRVKKVISRLGVTEGKPLRFGTLNVSSSIKFRSFITEHYEKFCQKVENDKPGEIYT